MAISGLYFKRLSKYIHLPIKGSYNCLWLAFSYFYSQYDIFKGDGHIQYIPRVLKNKSALFVCLHAFMDAC